MGDEEGGDLDLVGGEGDLRSNYVYARVGVKRWADRQREYRSLESDLQVQRPDEKESPQEWLWFGDIEVQGQRPRWRSNSTIEIGHIKSNRATLLLQRPSRTH